MKRENFWNGDVGSRLMLITQAQSQHSVLEQVKGFLTGGGRIVQLRSKHRPTVEVIAQGRMLLPLCTAEEALFLINDDVEAARVTQADGVHQGIADMPLPEARKRLGERAIIGATVHNEKELEREGIEHADYLGIGPLRFTHTKHRLSPLLGYEGIAKIIQHKEALGLTLPVFVVGGVDTHDVKPLLEVGAYGVAVSGSIALAGDVTFATKQFIHAFERNV